MTTDDIEQKAKAAVLAEETRANNWLQRNRAWLIALAAALLLGAVAGHALH